MPGFDSLLVENVNIEMDFNNMKYTFNQQKTLKFRANVNTPRGSRLKDEHAKSHLNDIFRMKKRKSKESY